MLVAYALLSMVSPRLSVPRRAEWWLAPLIGVVTGFIAIMTGVFVLPLVPYLQSLALEKDELIQALGLSLVVSAVALAIALAREGALPLAMLGASVAALAPAGLGVAIGQWCRQRGDVRAHLRGRPAADWPASCSEKFDMKICSEIFDLKLDLNPNPTRLPA
jgi:uncharacterized membrane protein YfcA